MSELTDTRPPRISWVKVLLRSFTLKYLPIFCAYEEVGGHHLVGMRCQSSSNFGREQDRGVGRAQGFQFALIDAFPGRWVALTPRAELLARQGGALGHCDVRAVRPPCRCET